jgi:hypothetical protein
MMMTLMYHMVRAIATSEDCPPTLDLQFDGAGQQTSKAALGMSAVFGAKWFPEVTTNRLLPGHSHGPIDRVTCSVACL